MRQICRIGGIFGHGRQMGLANSIVISCHRIVQRQRHLNLNTRSLRSITTMVMKSLMSSNVSKLLDKAVASIKSLQMSASVLKETSNKVVDVLESIDKIVYRGKLKDVATLTALKQTMLSVAKRIEEDSVVLSPIPSMGYVQYGGATTAIIRDTPKYLVPALS